MNTEDWKAIETAKALVIGHDPRLQKSDTIAQHVLFADYYFREEPTKPSERSKYGLAKATFDHINYLTNNKIKPETVYITNLCNESLPHAPKNKMVYIPRGKAIEGLGNIKKILKENPGIEYIFPMSLQVNYWLQKLGFYTSDNEFLELTEPREKGITNDYPYFEPKKNRTFLLVCGNIYRVKDGHQKVIPILHTKNYPLKGNFLEAYGSSYDRIRKHF